MIIILNTICQCQGAAKQHPGQARSFGMIEHARRQLVDALHLFFGEHARRRVECYLVAVGQQQQAIAPGRRQIHIMCDDEGGRAMLARQARDGGSAT